MPTSTPRKPIKNFFIKKDLQVRLIVKIVFSVLLATLVFAATLLLIYQMFYNSAAFYQVTLGGSEPEIGDRLDIITILLPTILISCAVNIILAFFVGLYASRKYAVPVYKLEQWAGFLAQGKLTAVLRFREKEEMKDLSRQCNSGSGNIRRSFLEIKKNAEILCQNNPEGEPQKNIMQVISKLELETGAMEIKTGRIKFVGDRNGENPVHVSKV